MLCTDGTQLATSDPGRALVTGKCVDIGKFKVPSMRGLAARAPYFHNGSAPNIEALIEFYNQRFNIGLTDQQKADLGVFLESL